MHPAWRLLAPALLLIAAPSCRHPSLAAQKVDAIPAKVPLRARLVVWETPAQDAAARAMAHVVALDVARAATAGSAWWTVTVTPADGSFADVRIDGRLESPRPGRLELRVRMVDAGEHPLHLATFHGDSPRALVDAAGPQVREWLDLLARHHGARRLMELADLRYASDLAPERFGPYLETRRDGTWDIARLPADDDALWLQIRRIRERERVLHEAVHAHLEAYALQARPVLEAYLTHVNEQIARRRALERENRWRPVKVVVGGFISGIGVFAEALGDAFGGRDRPAAWLYDQGDTLSAGVDHELENNRQALAAAAVLLEAEMKPVLLEFENRHLRLTGSAAEQVRRFREVLRAWHLEETGVHSP